MVFTAAEKPMRFMLNTWTTADKASTEKGQQVASLQAHLATLEPKDKKSYIAEWFQRCGPKGDLSGYLEATVVTKVKTSSKVTQGMMTPGEVGQLLGLRLEFYGMNVQLFKEALQAEISSNQVMHHLPLTKWEELETQGVDFFTTRHAYHSVAATEEILETEKMEKLTKAGELQAGKALSSQGVQDLTLELSGCAADTEALVPAGVDKKAEGKCQRMLAMAEVCTSISDCFVLAGFKSCCSKRMRLQT
eukprot:5525442-Amphidinium_carterae.2